jgi:AmmeMemoRadiSam system protein B
MFYPGDAGLLRTSVAELLAQAAPRPEIDPKALIVPHAGYVYSGAIAASGYVCLRTGAPHIRRVLLLGPAHRVGFYGLAASSARWFETPLGRVPVDRAGVDAAVALSQVFVYDDAHAQEHSLEVQLPFLQSVLGDFELLPLVVGEAEDEEVSEVVSALWDGPETLIVVSTDLSHHLDYAHARETDARTAAAIRAVDPAGIRPEGACGHKPLRALLRIARACGLRVEQLDLRNSGDTAGPRTQVVGYGAYALC